MNRRRDIYKLILDILIFIRTIFISFLCLLVFSNFLLKPSKIIGNSMFPTLEDGELVFSNVLLNLVGTIQYGDIVTVHEPNTKKLWVKRVIALPLDTIEIKNGIVYVNDVEVEETYLDQAFIQDVMEEQEYLYFTSDYPKITLKEDEYFLMGDNRISSTDSRVHGPFQRKDIIAKDIYVFFPFSKVKVLS